MNQGSNFRGANSSNRDNVRGEKDNPSIIKDGFPQEEPHPLSLQQHQSYKRFKRSQLTFSSIKINKPLPAPVHSILQIRFKFRSQLQLLPQIRCLIILRLESSIISIHSNITNSIIRKVINVVLNQERSSEELQP